MQMLVKSAKMIARYNAWANELVYDAVEKLMPTVEVADHKNIILQKIIRTLNHIYIVDLIWKAHLKGHEHGFTERNPTHSPPLYELQRQQIEIDHWYIAWCDSKTDADLSREINFSLIGGKKGRMTRHEIIVHVINHTSYHRGMIANSFLELSLKLPATDLMVFFEYQKDEG